jgi:hypothetical protein
MVLDLSQYIPITIVQIIVITKDDQHFAMSDAKPVYHLATQRPLIYSLEKRLIAKTQDNAVRLMVNIGILFCFLSQMDIGIRNLFEIENKIELFWKVEKNTKN